MMTRKIMIRKKVRRALAGILLTAMFCMTAACGGKNGENVSEKHMVLGSTGYFTTSSADTAADYNGWYEMMMGICESLFRLDEQMVPQPYLAESYENVDALTWKFELKEGVTFHNGEQMTAESVKKCFERTMQVNARALSQIPIESIEADGQTLTIVTKTPVPTMIGDLSDSIWNIYYVGEGVDYAEHPYCTGPFEITEYQQGVSTKVKAYEAYWGGKAKLETAEFLVVGDSDSLAMALQKGEVDLIVNPSAASLALFRDEDKFTIDKQTCTRATYMQFNIQNDRMKDVKLRQAINMCVDREAYAEVIMHGTAVPSYGIFAENLPFGGTEGLHLTVDSFDPEGAAKLLKEAGWKDTNKNGTLDKDGVELELDLITFSSRPELGTLGDALQSQLAQIGVKLNVQVLESTSDALKSGAYDINLGSFTMAPTGDSGSFFNTRIVTGAPNNQAGYSNALVDSLVAELNREFDSEKRIELTRKISQELLNDCYFAFPANSMFMTVYSTDVQGFRTHPCEFYLIDNKTELAAK